MASLLENLIEILDRENTEYEKLVVLSDRKTPVIIQGDIDTLGSITEQEQEIVGRIQNLEKQRTEALADIANVVNRDVETLVFFWFAKNILICIRQDRSGIRN